MQVADLVRGRLYVHKNGLVYRYHGAIGTSAVIHCPTAPLKEKWDGVGETGHDPALLIAPATVDACKAALRAANKSRGYLDGLKLALRELSPPKA